MTLTFHMTADQALQFFQLANELGLETEEERIGLLQEMIAAGFDIAVFQTNRTPEQIAKDYSRHGTVLHIKMEEDDGLDLKENEIN